MKMDYEAALSNYEKFLFSSDPWTLPVYRRGLGPAVIVIHEIPGLHLEVIRFADRVVGAGMTVYLPVLFGEPGRPVTTGYTIRSMVSAICMRREFNCWSAGKSSPIVKWLRALARRAHTECGGRGVGAVGMCFTGGFADDDRARRSGARTLPALLADCVRVEKACRRHRCIAAGDRLRSAALRR
jgi:dienelactone hydrolase